jgi:RNA polymerase sigma-70 factor (ECF subfamily)
MSADPASDDRCRGSTSRSLLAGVRQDDSAAWIRLVNLYAPLVAAWCRRWQVAEQDVLDVLQDVFGTVAKNLVRFRKEQPHDTFRGWLATIARNKVRDYYRRRSKEPIAAGGTESMRRMSEVADTHPAQQITVPMDDPALGDVLQRALASIRGEFKEKTWQAFWRVVVEGRAAADVAAELSMQPGAVRVSKSRVLARLRRELGDVG